MGATTDFLCFVHVVLLCAFLCSFFCFEPTHSSCIPSSIPTLSLFHSLTGEEAVDQTQANHSSRARLVFFEKMCRKHPPLINDLLESYVKVRANAEVNTTPVRDMRGIHCGGSGACWWWWCMLLVFGCCVWSLLVPRLQCGCRGVVTLGLVY